jgi:hypothetical protein
LTSSSTTLGWRTGATSFNKPFVLARETAITRPLPGSVSEQEREIHLALVCFGWTHLDRDCTHTDYQSATFAEVSVPHQPETPHQQPLETTIPAIWRKRGLTSKDSNLLKVIWQSISRNSPAFLVIMITAVSSEGINGPLSQPAYG